MAAIVAAYLVHERSCPTRQAHTYGPEPECEGCEPTPFFVEARFDAPPNDDVVEGIRRARLAAMEAAIDYVAEHQL